MPHISIAKARQEHIPHITLQTIEIPLNWSIPKSIGWLNKHGYVVHDYRETSHYRRFWQVRPIEGAKYFSKKLSNGVVFTWQKYS